METIRTEIDKFADIIPRTLGKGDKTKFRIIRAAVEMIAMEGVTFLSFDSLGKKLKMSASQVRYHFSTKNELINRAIQYVLLAAQNAVLDSLSKSENGCTSQVMAIFEGFFDWLEANPHHGAVYIHFFYLSSVKKEYFDFHRHVDAIAVKRMQAVLEPLKLKNNWSDEQLSSFSNLIWSIAEGNMFYSLAIHKKEERTYFRKEALKSIETIVDNAEMF